MRNVQELNSRLQYKFIKMTQIIIISAISENNAIGKNNDIPWHIPEDFKRFKRVTSGHPCIMGDKTYESLPVKPLPKRVNIICSRKPGYTQEGAIVFDDFDKAIEYCKKQEFEKTFIIGGGMIYKLGLLVADKLDITRVHKTIEDADVFFPDVNWENWKLISDEKHEGYSFQEYVRK